jgi:hypothetical protein
MKNSEQILDGIDSRPLSHSLGQTLRLSARLNLFDFEKWCRLELEGYYASNPAMDENVVVPEYRTVVGQHADYYGRPLMVGEDLFFINEDRLRFGVPEMENLLSTRDMVVIQDPGLCSLIKQHLNVDVHVFRFSSSLLSGVLSSIKLQLSDRLLKVSENSEFENSVSRKEDIIELKPNIYGVGLNLRALWKKCIGRSK